MTSGMLQPVGGDHSLVLAAAQMLAQKASLVEARAQVKLLTRVDQAA